MDKITVVCHKDHDKGYEDFQGKCLLCEVERLQNREWVGLTKEERHQCVDYNMGILRSDDPQLFDAVYSVVDEVEKKLKEKNT